MHSSLPSWMCKTQTTHSRSTPSQKSTDGQFDRYDGIPEALWSVCVYVIWGGDASACLVDFEPCCRFSWQSVGSFWSLWGLHQLDFTIGGAQVCRFSIRSVISCERRHGNAAFNMVERAATVAVAWKPCHCLPNCGLHTSNAECAYSAQGLQRYCLSVCQRNEDALLLPLMRNHNYHVVMGIKWMQRQGHYERVFSKLMEKLAFLDLVLDLIHLCAVTVDACMINYYLFVFPQ